MQSSKCFLVLGVLLPLFAVRSYSQFSAFSSHETRLMHERGVNIQVDDNSVISLRSQRSGETVLKNVKNMANGPTADLVIDLRTLDTAQYSSRYRFWREVPVANTYKGVTVADINRNGRKEIYSIYKDFASQTQGCVYEYQSDSSFLRIATLPDSVYWGWSYADVDGDGLIEMAYHLNNSLLLIDSQQDSNSLPITPKSVFDTVSSSGQPSRVTFFNVDSDNKPELIYYLDGGGGIFPPGNQIAKYNTQNNRFEVVYYNHPNRYSAGFAFGDFDLDGKKNIANGGINGEFFMYEHQFGNNYSMKLVDTIPTNNAYLSATTNDVDGDGKPELWMGGDFFYNGVGITRLVLYETNGDDSYERKYQIDIIGVFSFFAGNMVAADLDNDGKEEIVLCVDQNVLVFKNTGGNSYALWYIKKNDLALSGANSVFYEITVADFDNDRYPELMIGMDQVIENKGIRFFSRIYKFTQTTEVKPGMGSLPTDFVVSQNYPNPFNSETTIRYALPKVSNVTIQIYNILGKEVRKLHNSKEEDGEHVVRWDGKDKEARDLPSGVYFVRFQANQFTKTVKAMLVK